MNRLRFLKEKYKDIKIGYSTHENPDETNNISMAISMGATIFEKHIGLKTEAYSLLTNILQTFLKLKSGLKMQKKPMKYVEIQKCF